MFNAEKILKSLTTGDSLGMAAKAGGGGALAGGLFAALGGKKPEKIARSALTTGGLAAVAGLAYQAWRNHEAQKAGGGGAAAGAAPAQAGAQPSRAELQQAGFLPAPGAAPADRHNPALLILESMIYAARADGEVDAAEHRTIQAAIAQSGFDAEEKAFLMDAFGRPVDLNAFAGRVGSPQAAMDVYTAAYAVTDPPTLPERAHLDMLRNRLGLSEGVAQAIEAQVDAAAPRLAAPAG